MQASDTIAAISSAVGAAARMIVRASGPLVCEIHRSLIQQTEFVERSAKLRQLHFAGMIVPAWVYCFRSTGSATGEDVLELHISGNPLLARLLLEELIRLGARQAEPGEFTARAYFNARLSLTQAEGVAATIAAQSERELSAARQLLAGELARRVQPILDGIANTLALVEVGIDFSEEDVSFLTREQIIAHLNTATASLDELLSQSSRFERLSHEPAIVLVGRPNAGKSTLLNALAGHDRAVVSSQAGTTRDILWAHARLLRGIVRIIDIAGLENPADDDSIARMMQQQAQRAIAEADLLVFVRDSTDKLPPIELSRAPDLKLATKSDLQGLATADELPVSARAGQNMDQLRDRLDRLAFGQSTAGAALALNARHVRAIKDAQESLARAMLRVSDSGAEVLALELREALDALGGILGMVTPDDVLGRIFAGFCIGK